MPVPVPHRFHIVDVFAETRHAGNTLAVVLDAADLDTTAMQAIAREFGFSETTFVVSPAQAPATKVRIFTPAEELPFAGHPTLGSAWVIREHLLRTPAKRVTLALGVGDVPVDFESAPDGGERAWLTAPPVTLGPTLAPARLAPVLGLAPGDFAQGLPVQHVSGGPSFLHVPLASLAALERAQFDLAAFAALAAEGFPPNLYLFAPGPRADFHARTFFVAGGVREDPATGSATAFLGAYLLAHGGHGERFALQIEQGAQMQRPSRLFLEVTGPAAGAKIRVGGRVLASAHGELL